MVILYGNLLKNPLFKTYIFYSSLLILKMLAMSIYIGTLRVIYKAFLNPEDCVNLKVEPQVDERVERVRRAHLNDLENIPLFLIVCCMYILTDPYQFLAMNLIRIYTAARFIHTIVYAVLASPQPARSFSWAVGYFITGYMAVITAWTLLQFY